jgi:hypothetical protein
MKRGFKEMAEAKEKKVKITEREIVRDMLTKILVDSGSNVIGRTKEGLVLAVNDNHVVVKTILKKEKVERKDFVETF